MSSGDPSTYYGKPDPDEGQHVSTFPIGISGLPTEPYDFSLGDPYYEGIGGEGEMSWFTFILYLLAFIAIIGLLIYVYLWYSKVSQASSIANTAVQAVSGGGTT